MAKGDKLTPQQEVFCQQWVIQKFNGKQAALSAKYAEKSAESSASRLLSMAKVQKRCAQILKSVSKKFENQKEEIIHELREMSFSDIANYLTVEEGGAVIAKTFEEMPKGASRMIKKIKTKRTIRESKDGSESMIIDDTFEFELWSKEKALEMLGKVEALFTDNVNHKGRIGVDLSGKSDEELDQMEKDLNG